MKEITFEELIEGKAYIENKIFEDDEDVKVVDYADVLNILQQVREATIVEIENKANEYGEYGTADYVHEMLKDRILTP